MERGARERRGERLRALVTLDGPAGSGKSSTAREVARRLGYRHLDSGALYRAVTFALLESGISPDRWSELSAADLDALGLDMESDARGIRITHHGRRLDADLRSPAVTGRVSALSALPQVRAWLLDVQRRAGAEGGLVAEGRDMGTVVFPDADIKIFLTADLEERARRRLNERGDDPGPGDTVAQEADLIRERDRRDSERSLSPLKRPSDAVELDTTSMAFERQVEHVVELVNRWEASRRS